MNFRNVRACRLRIRNARKEFDEDAEQFQPTFKTDLWKLGSEGDPLVREDWKKRPVWIAENGALCYESAKAKRPLVYHSPQVLRQVQLSTLPDEKSCMPFAFKVTLPPS